MPSKDDRDIMVIQREILFAVEAYFIGFRGVWDAPEPGYATRVNKHHEFMRRGDAEIHSSYKQPIPFLVPVRRRTNEVFTSKYQGQEERLRGQMVIASMGHIERCDMPSSDPILDAAERELHEELLITGSKGRIIPVPFGYLNIEDDHAGKFHFGFVYLILADGLEIRANDDSIANPKFEKISELEEKCKTGEVKLDSWSAATIPELRSYLEN